MVKYLLVFISIFCFSTGYTQEENIIAGDIIVKLKKSETIESFCRDFAFTTNLKINLIPQQRLSVAANIWLLRYDFENQEPDTVLEQVRRHEGVLIAQHNHSDVILRTTTPNDTQFNSQWAHQNSGQSGGTAGVDMDTPDAWDITTGGLTTQGDEIVVAIVDAGFQLNHPDIAPNLWVNTNEIPGNGIDDDNNGYIDDINGWDAFGNDGTIPSDDHGTHVSGIAGARGDNNQGVSGINWDVKLMMVAGSSGNEATVIAAYGYILDERTLYNTTNGVEGSFVVSTNSSFGIDFGNSANFPLWCAMYDDLGLQGVISAVATANLNIDVDVSGDVPSTCTSVYMIGVTNTTDTDTKLTGAAFGATSIDLGAPGTGILSTLQGSSYGNLTGTSMATPQVAGTVGLLMASACDKFITDYKSNPALFALDLKDAILDGVDPNTSLNGITVTGGRLNVYNAIKELNPGPNGTCVPDFILTASQIDKEICTPSDATYTINVDSILGFADPVTLSITGNPAGTTATFSSNPVTPGTSTTLTISNTNGVPAGISNLIVSGTATSITNPKTVELELGVQVNTPSVATLLSPADVSTNISNLTTLTWTASTDASSYNIDIATDAAFSNIIETGTPIGTSYTPIGGLAFNTTYFWRVSPTNSCGSGMSSTTFSFTTQNVSYCTTSGNDASEEWIDSIVVAGVTNTSGTNGGYGDFSSTIIEVNLNQSYNFTLTPAWENTLFDEYWVIWIDYNNNGVFTDAGETVYDAGAANQNVQTGTFTIPTTAALGNVRMRISMRFNIAPAPCGNFNFGEVEDYTINISDPAGCQSDVIKSGSHVAGTIEVIESGSFINSDAVVQLGTNITYDAANCIELLPNFETELGSEFEAIIEGCGGATTLSSTKNTADK